MGPSAPLPRSFTLEPAVPVLPVVPAPIRPQLDSQPRPNLRVRPAPTARNHRFSRPLRHRLGRLRASRRWLPVTAVAVLLGLSVTSVVREADATIARFGPVRTVWMTTRQLPVGATISEGDVALRDVPIGAVTEGSMGPNAGPNDNTDRGPVGRVVRQPMLAGEPVVESRLGQPGVDGGRALLDPGYRALTLPSRPQRSTAGVSLGAVADLVAIDRVDGRAATVARNARVIEVVKDTGEVSVAVADVDVEATAAAIVDGTVVLAVHHAG